MELFNRIKTFLTSNHLWMRIYKPQELSDPIAKAIRESGENTAGRIEKVFSKVSAIKGEKEKKETREKKVIREISEIKEKKAMTVNR